MYGKQRGYYNKLNEVCAEVIREEGASVCSKLVYYNVSLCYLKKVTEL